MVSFLDGLATTVNRAFCGALGSVVNQADLLQYVLTPGFGEQYNPFPLLYAQNCPTTRPIPAPNDFTGGQCVGVQYRVFYTKYQIAKPGSGFEDSQSSSSVVVTGAVQGTATDSDPASNTLTAVLLAAATPSGSGREPLGTVNKNFYTNVYAVITSISRVDGQPDTCGNPGGGTPPAQPGYNIRNDNVTYNDTTNNNVTIPVILTFGYATLNLDGTINVPINANFTANPTFNANLNFNLNTGRLVPDFSNPAAPLPSPCSDPGGFVPDPSIPSPPPSIPDGDPLPAPTDQPTERERLLKGCIVTTSVLDGNETVIFQSDNPDLYVPSLGYVQFLIRVGDSTAWTNDLPVKSLRTFIPCPWDGGAIDVRGTARYGNVFVVTPVYVTRTFNPTYPAPS